MANPQVTSLETQTDSDGVTTLTLNRPDRHNALDRTFIDELQASLDSGRHSTRILVLQASGDNFCAGADIDWMKASASLSTQENHEDAMALSNLLETLNRYPHPVVGRVQGAAVGGGAGLVSCCDHVIAGETAFFAFPEIRLGIIAATISPYVLAAMGPRLARRYLLTGERFDAVTAYRMHLVHDVCSSSDLDNRVKDTIDKLLLGSPAAQHATKQLIADTALRAIDDPLREELAQQLAAIRASDEGQEGLNAFLEKRKASWQTR